MRLLGIRGRSKRPEGTTDDSQLSASSWKNTLKLLKLSRHRSIATPVKLWKQKSAHNELEHQQPETDDDQTDSGLDLFQTLMSNAVEPSSHARSQSVGPAGGKKDPASLQYWHTSDPNFLPTAYPLTRSDPRAHPEPRWGSLNLAASAALLEGPLKRFYSDKRPRFRFGPRLPAGSENDSDRDSQVSSTTTRSRSAVDNSAAKFAYISQDGKLVEREVRRWPMQKNPKLNLRYKLCEPYATNYGKMYRKRESDSMMKFTLPRVKWIYERPIYMLPKSIVNENKRRLMARHTLKDMYEPGSGFRLPQVVSLEEGEQCKRFREFQTLKYIRDTEERVAHEEKVKLKMLR